MTDSLDQKLNSLIEREREILKKIAVATRAMASPQIMGQLNFLLEECRFEQSEIRMLKGNKGKDSSFDDYLSIG